VYGRLGWISKRGRGKQTIVTNEEVREMGRKNNETHQILLENRRRKNAGMGNNGGGEFVQSLNLFKVHCTQVQNYQNESLSYY
jgi:hypothetical protein